MVPTLSRFKKDVSNPSILLSIFFCTSFTAPHEAVVVAAAVVVVVVVPSQNTEEGSTGTKKKRWML